MTVLGSSSKGYMADFAADGEAFGKELSEKDRKFLNLVEIGFTEDEASSAIDICGQDEPVSVLADAIYAAQIAKRSGGYGGNFANVELSADEVAFIKDWPVGRHHVHGIPNKIACAHVCITREREV